MFFSLFINEQKNIFIKVLWKICFVINKTSLSLRIIIFFYFYYNILFYEFVYLIVYIKIKSTLYRMYWWYKKLYILIFLLYIKYWFIKISFYLCLTSSNINWDFYTSTSSFYICFNFYNYILQRYFINILISYFIIEAILNFIQNCTNQSKNKISKNTGKKR